MSHYADIVPLRKLGRARKFRSPEHFRALAVDCAARCHENDVPLTLKLMQMYLGFANPKDFFGYAEEQGNEAFTGCADYAQGLVETYLHHGLNTGDGSTAGKKFLLELMHDKTAADANTTINVNLTAQDMEL